MTYIALGTKTRRYHELRTGIESFLHLVDLKRDTGIQHQFTEFSQLADSCLDSLSSKGYFSDWKAAIQQKKLGVKSTIDLYC